MFSTSFRRSDVERLPDLFRSTLDRPAPVNPPILGSARVRVICQAGGAVIAALRTLPLIAGTVPVPAGTEFRDISARIARVVSREGPPDPVSCVFPLLYRDLAAFGVSMGSAGFASFERCTRGIAAPCNVRFC